MLFHDLRRLVQGVIGPADTLEMALDDDNVELAKTSLGRIRDNADRLVEMLGHFMASRQDSQAGNTQSDVAQVLDDVVESLSSTLRRKGIEVRRTVLPAVTAAIDRKDLHRILLNLLANAIEATNGHGNSIEVEAKPVGGGWIQLKMCDKGCGITKRDLVRIFKEGYTTRAQSGGNGLGLAIVRQIVEANHGSVKVRSRPGKGACFYVHLPSGQNGSGDKKRAFWWQH
jgi:signal transduction histidine kinase